LALHLKSVLTLKSDLKVTLGAKPLTLDIHSKLGLILFTRLLAKKLEGTNVTVNCVHPGMNKTDLGRDAGGFSRMIFKLMEKKLY